MLLGTTREDEAVAYVREKRVPGKGGKIYRYYQLVEGRRVDGKVRQHVIKHLGRFNSVEEARASLAVSNSAPVPGVVPKTERGGEGEIRKKIKRLRAAALRRRHKVDDATVTAYRAGVKLTDVEWALVGEIEGEIKRLTMKADELREELERRRQSASSQL
jgi:transcription initiation factor IIE alpha subunit